MQELRIECLAPRGLGFGDGSISYNRRAETEVPRNEIESIEKILQDPREILVEVDTENGGYLDDDGCGDGRGVTNESGEVVQIKQGSKEYKRSLNRAKQFGGTVAMAMAASIAQYGHENPQLNSLATISMDQLDEHAIDYGAHTDEHAGSGKSGCGAIDNAPAIIANAVKYENEIADTIHALDPSVDDDLLTEVLDSYRAYAAVDQANYSGEGVMTEIDSREKVIKQLVSGHNEMFVVLNDVENHTVNQDTVREASNGAVQVFAVDLWRTQNINERMYPDETERRKALLGQLVYTLSTAATLTDGSLPVYRISPHKEPVGVLS